MLGSNIISDLNFAGKSNQSEVIDLTTTDYTNPVPFSVYVGVSGTLKVDMAAGNTVTFSTAVIGYHPILVTKVYKVGTDADGLVAMWSI